MLGVILAEDPKAVDLVLVARMNGDDNQIVEYMQKSIVFNLQVLISYQGNHFCWNTPNKLTAAMYIFAKMLTGTSACLKLLLQLT